MDLTWRIFGSLVLVVSLVLAGCGDDEGGDTSETIENIGDEVEERANDAWASFRTNAERLVDEAEAGDNEAQDELLDECRDALQDLREADDPAADRLEDVCDEIRDADDESAWDELREEIEEIESDR